MPPDNDADGVWLSIGPFAVHGGVDVVLPLSAVLIYVYCVTENPPFEPIYGCGVVVGLYLAFAAVTTHLKRQPETQTANIILPEVPDVDDDEEA